MANHQHQQPVEVLTRANEVPPQFILPPHLRTPLDAQITSLPVIDLSELHIDRQNVIDKIHSACREWGFFQVLNHGVSIDALQSLRTRIHEFLALPDSEKGHQDLFQGDDGQGFGTAFVNPHSGTAEWRDYILLHSFPESLRNYTKWPPSFQNDLETLTIEIMTLTRNLLAIISENLKLAPSFIEDAMDGLHQKVVISHYPPCPKPDIATGSFEHTDTGTLTCLWQASEDVSGLQVCKDGQWYYVDPIPGAVVVNIGDQVQIVSNGLYNSGIHRVVLNESKSRVSVIFFHNPSATAVISPAPTLVDDDNPAKYPATPFKLYAAKYGLVAK